MLKPSQVCSSNTGWPALVSQVCMHLLSASAQIQASLLLRLHMKETLVVACMPESVFKSNFLCVLSSSSHFNTSFLISSSGLQYFPFNSAQFKSHHEADTGRGGTANKILSQLMAIVTAILSYSLWAISYFSNPVQSASYSDAKKK